MSSRRFLRWAVLWVALAAPGLAAAAEPVFPAGSGTGIVPPPEMTLSARFMGFEGPAGTSIVLTEMPALAFPELRAGLTPERMRSQGFSGVERKDLTLKDREALLLSGEQTVGSLTVRKWILVTASPQMTALVVATVPKGDTTYPDAVLRDAVLSTVLRSPASLDEQVAALPFRIGDQAGFRLVPTVVGNGLILTDGPRDIDPDGEQPSVIVAASMGPAPIMSSPDSFGRRALAELSSLRDVDVEESRTFERTGATWHEILVRANHSKTGRPVTVLQAIRFAPDGSGYLRVIATTRRDQRDAVLPRFRQVAASVGPR